MNELLTQLEAVINGAAADRNDAVRWQLLVKLLTERGYGPRIGPAEIADLVPDVRKILALVETTREVAPAPEEPKSGHYPRRKLTAEDEQQIEAGRRQGFDAGQLAVDLGVAKASVARYLNERRG